ncbi:GntR family transcriptional regulator [Agromyces sp. G08B096]|uniref:GntR family transcriptional regulator n=1 Tax=Agromyces sp. G08B096 TaxID=3156399 RepID=A0AAU7W6P5_9MICO
MTATDATAVGRVAAALRAEILSGDLGAGEPLREEQAAARFGVSRHTVRAAFQRLVAERLAIAEPYRGVRVTSFDRDQIVALQQLRSALEAEAVRIACERFGSAWPAEVLAPAEEALERLDALAEASAHGAPAAAAGSAATDGVPSRAEWLEAERLHADVHRALVEASGSPRIIEAHAGLGSELLLFLLHVRPHYSLAGLAREHRALVADVQRRGPAAIHEHLAHSTRLLVGD